MNYRFSSMKRMYMIFVVVLIVAAVGIAGPAFAGLGTSPSLSLSTSLIAWRWVEPITLYAGLGTSPSKMGDGGPVQNAILEFYINDQLIGTGSTGADGNIELSFDASSLLPGVYTVEVRFAGGCIDSVCYEPSSRYQLLTVQGSFTFVGFQSPVIMDGWNTVKAGQTVPMKWQLTAPDGNYVGNLGAVQKLETGPAACAGGYENALQQAETSGLSGLRYDTETNQYLYTFQTDKSWTGTCRRFLLTLSDGTAHSAYFQFR